MIIPEIEEIFDDIKSEQSYNVLHQEDGRTVSVNSFTHNVGSFYEKIRYMVDYKDEHNIARDAVARMLKRILLYHNKEKVGEMLLKELVSGRYIPNDVVSEKISELIKGIVAKYFSLASSLGLTDELAVHLASSEIELYLNPRVSESAVANGFYKVAKKRIVRDDIGFDVNFDICLYIACRKKIFDEDIHGLRYFVIQWLFPGLRTFKAGDPIPDGMEQKMAAALRDIDECLESPLLSKLMSRLRNEGVYFSLVHEMIKQNGMGAKLYFDSQTALEQKVREMMTDIYAAKKKLLARSGIQAVVYVLATKIVIALAVEVPYEYFFLNHLDYLALGVNVIFHPLLLMTMVNTAPKGDAKNTDAIVEGLSNILYGGEQKPIYIKRAGPGGFASFVYGILYVILYVVVLGGIFTILNKLNFNIASITLFLLFLGLVSYFGIRIRHKARQWIVSTKRTSLPALAWDYFTLPVVKTGKYLGEKFSTVNVFVFILDFIIETPFKIILGTFDNFVSYLNDKRDELI